MLTCGSKQPLKINNHSLKVSRTAHYTTYGELTKKTKHIWFVLHGYGQTSEQLISKFDMLDNKDHFVIAPEGLSKFYWHTNNEPVASWMTSKYRYSEIDDFCEYLSQLYSLYCTHVNYSVRINFFGFSQGCATLWRWMHVRQPRYHTLINWAGWIPEDISYVHLKEYFSDKKNYLIYGDADEYITDDSRKGIDDVIRVNDLKFEIIRFEGSHRIPKDALSNFLISENLT